MLLNGLFSVLIEWMTEWMVALFHNTAWLNTSMLDGANPLDMIDLLATMPRGYDSNAHNGFASTLHWLFYLGLRAPAVARGPVRLFELAISSWKQCRVLFLLVTRSRAPCGLWIADGDLYSHDAVNSSFVLERGDFLMNHRITNSSMPNFVRLRWFHRTSVRTNTFDLESILYHLDFSGPINVNDCVNMHTNICFTMNQFMTIFQI